MNTKKDIIGKGKHLAFLLRHDKEAFRDGRIDCHGWRMVSELAQQGYTRKILDEIVATNDKQRYEYSPDGRRIRARQGHSIPVDVELVEATPPDILFHGTATRFLQSIFRDGLVPGKRLYVHLSPDEQTAIKVGQRHGTPYVIGIDCRKMRADGCTFWRSNNGVWLTKVVNQCYFVHQGEEPLQLSRVELDWSFDDDEHFRYKFGIEREKHSLREGMRIQLEVWGRPDERQTATVTEVLADGFIMQADGYVDIAEEYNITQIEDEKA